MQFANFHSQNECEDHCPECTASPPPPGEQCVRCGRTAGERSTDWYNDSHLVGDPVTQHETGFNPAHFEELLTDYDRVLLQFGVHISWKP